MFNFFNHNTKQECEIELLKGYEDISTTKNILREIQEEMKQKEKQEKMEQLHKKLYIVYRFGNNYCATKNCVNYTLQFFNESRYICTCCNHVKHYPTNGNGEQFLGLKPLTKKSNCLKCKNIVIIETQVKGTCNLCYKVIDIQKLIYNGSI